MIRETIYVAGYPKSGNTWLTRLLAEVLDSPSGGCRPQDDKDEVATEGQRRLGPYVVRKGHFRPVDYDDGPVVPREHRLAWKQITNQKVILIYRDPRDVIVSGAYYWKNSIATQMSLVIEGIGSMRLHGAWDEYMREWLTLEDKISFAKISYERLLRNTYQSVCYVLGGLRIAVPRYDKVNQAIYNQSFEVKKKNLIERPHNPKYTSKFHKHFMRKGKAGGWKEEMPSNVSQKVYEQFKDTMEVLGYVK